MSLRPVFGAFDAENSWLSFYRCELQQLHCLSVYIQTPGQSTHEGAPTRTDSPELSCASEGNRWHLQSIQTGHRKHEAAHTESIIHYVAKGGFRTQHQRPSDLTGMP